jgi:hypothetical protein
MSKKWSSFGEQQLLTENWRKFLTEEEVQTEEIEEGFLGRIGTAAKAGAKAARKSWDETRPKPMVDYPATEMTTIVNLISSVAEKNKIQQFNLDLILKQLEDMLKAQNFVIKEEINGGELMLGQPLNLVLNEVPALEAFLKQIPADDANLIMQAFQRGGFKIGDVPVAQQKQAQSAAGQQSQSQDDIELPEPEPQAQTITPEQRDQMVNSLINADDRQTFIKLYDALSKSSFGQGENSIKELMKAIAETSKFKEENDLNFRDERLQNVIKAILEYVSSYGSDKGEQIKGKFMELIIKPILGDDEVPPEQQARIDTEPSSQEPDEVPDDSGSLQDTPDSPEPEAQTQDAPKEETTPEDRVKKAIEAKYQGDNFEDDFNKFIEAFKGVAIKERISYQTAADGLGITKYKYKKIAKEHSAIVKAIGKISVSDAESFLKDLKQAIKGTPKPAPAPEPPPEEEKEKFVKFPDDFPTDLDTIYQKAGISTERFKDEKKKDALYYPFTFGSNGTKMDFELDPDSNTFKLKPADSGFKTGDPEKDSAGDQTRFRTQAQDHWLKIYNRITKDEDRRLTQTQKYVGMAYLSGLMKALEGGRVFEEQETLNESTMVRWKELAGIL